MGLMPMVSSGKRGVPALYAGAAPAMETPPVTLALQIVVYVAAIDGFRASRRFKTLEGARRFAQ